MSIDHREDRSFHCVSGGPTFSSDQAIDPIRSDHLIVFNKSSSTVIFMYKEYYNSVTISTLTARIDGITKVKTNSQPYEAISSYRQHTKYIRVVRLNIDL